MVPFLTVLVCWSGALAAETPPQAVITYVDHIRLMTDLDRLWQPPAEGERCIQFSSYDRGSERGQGTQEAQPWDPKGWYANIDRGAYLREETRGGKTEYVLADAAGAGAIVRIWSANPTGTLFFYLDGAAEPTWSVGFKELTSGAVPPLVEPLAGMRGRGCNYHAPIPFATHVKVTCSDNDHHYHVNVLLYPAGTRVEPFSLALLERHQDALAQARKDLSSPPALASLTTVRRTGMLEMSGDPHDPAEWAAADVPLEGPLVIRNMTLALTSPGGGAVDSAVLRKILFCIDLEGRRTVRVPVCDFFGSAPGFKPYHGFPLGVTADGRGYCRFPVPIRDRGTVSVVADGPLAPVMCELTVSFERRPVPENALTFRASWHLRKGIRTRPFSEFRVLNARGPGRFVGCCLVVANPSRYWWGEGDEKFFVDGEAFPSTFGTGTEDYFGYAWADTNAFSSPYHAQPECDGPENAGYTCLDRFQIHDSVPFRTSFLFDLEVWSWRDVYMDYASTAYWYGLPEASSGLPFVPDPVYRRADPVEREIEFAAANAIEGEALEVVAATKGTTETPLMGWYSDRKWSGGMHLWWQGAGPGDTLTLSVPVERAGRYRLQAVFTSARDYAVIRVRFNGLLLGEQLDLFTPYTVEPTKRLDLGTVDLAAGAVPLVFEIVGSNPRAVPRYMVGLDYLRLVPE